MRRYMSVALLMLELSLGSVRTAPAGLYLFQQIDVPGSTDTIATGINDSDEIVGGFSNTSGMHGFHLVGGNFTPPINFPGAPATGALGINNSHQIVGYFRDSSGQIHGFHLAGGNFTPLNVSGATILGAYGINNHDHIVGLSQDAKMQVRGYLLSGNTFTQFGSDELTYGINDDGWIVGTGFNDQAMLLKKKPNTTVSTTFLFPGSNSTHALGINKGGQIVGNFIKATQSHGFLAQASPAPAVSSFLQLDVPGSLGTAANGINTAGKIVGAFADRNNREHGFLARPLQARLPIHVKLSSVFPNQKPLRITFFSTDDFDATSILPDSVRFGVLDLPGPTPSGALPTQVVMKDVNLDGREDLLLYFNAQDLGLQCDDTVVSLEGQTDSGELIGGQEPIKVKCKRSQG